MYLLTFQQRLRLYISKLLNPFSAIANIKLNGDEP